MVVNFFQFIEQLIKYIVKIEIVIVIVIAMKLYFHFGSDVQSYLMARKEVEMRIMKLIFYL
jgi:hypothetical protein